MGGGLKAIGPGQALGCCCDFCDVFVDFIRFGREGGQNGTTVFTDKTYDGVRSATWEEEGGIFAMDYRMTISVTHDVPSPLCLSDNGTTYTSTFTWDYESDASNYSGLTVVLSGPNDSVTLTGPSAVSGTQTVTSTLNRASAAQLTNAIPVSFGLVDDAVSFKNLSSYVFWSTNRTV